MIKIINDFFEQDKFKKVIHHIKNNIFYTPQWTGDGSHEKKNFYGNRFCLNNDEQLLKTFVKQSEKKFNIKIKKLYDDCGIDIRNLDKFFPHIDAPKSDTKSINVLIMLDGPIGVTTGTVFYTDGELDIHVGFRPNRAILFPSTYYHSSHKSEIENLKRYTASIFIREYD